MTPPRAPGNPYICYPRCQCEERSRLWKHANDVVSAASPVKTMSTTYASEVPSYKIASAAGDDQKNNVYRLLQVEHHWRK